jgi:SAM-dependent methyltransferase
MLEIEPTKRFSSRVGYYVRSRPSYPNGILRILEQDCGFCPSSVVADIGSGTGIFTRLLLGQGNRVFGVEPNREMRRAAEEYLAEYANFLSVDGTAEATALPSHSVELVTCAQAAHWFERDNAVREFRRILKPKGFVLLVWNERRIEGSAFGSDYEELVSEFGTDYDQLSERGRASASFFGRCPWVERKLGNYQDLDYPALEERLLSSSYVPQLGDERCPPMLSKLRQIFERYQQAGRIRMEYDTKLYVGQLGEADNAAVEGGGLDW